jgi:hypothetical protein
MFLDTFHTLATVWMLWDFTVDNFGNLGIFTHLPWAYPTTPIFIVRLISYPFLTHGSHPLLFGLGIVSCSHFGPFLSGNRIVLWNECSFDGSVN